MLKSWWGGDSLPTGNNSVIVKRIINHFIENERTHSNLLGFAKRWGESKIGSSLTNWRTAFQIWITSHQFKN